MDRRDELVEEIKQISKQYEDEVPGRGRSWPNSIKDRVLEMRELGMSFAAISRATELPYFTVLRWKPGEELSSGQFQRLPVVVEKKQNRGKVVTAAVAAQVVTVTTSKGLKIEGLSYPQFVEIFERLNS